MKIGILTYHQAENFGAIIQAYALQSYLGKCGHEAEIINYRCKAIERNYQIFNPSILWSRKNILLSFKEYTKRFSNIGDRMTRKRKFRNFVRENLNLSSPINKIDRPLKYDAVITGSDQVWNFYLNKGSEEVYLLDFPFDSHTLKIAYAASSERNGLSRIAHETLTRCLAGFNRISVRESFLKNDLAPYTQKRIDICLDPTFLLTKEDYLKLARTPQQGRYILVYHMTAVPEIMPWVSRLADSCGCKVIELYGGYQKGCKDTRVGVITDWGPCEVLGLINGAEMIFTTSFHGLALSLILQKNVWVIDKGDNFRQKNLLESAGLTNRLLGKNQDYIPGIIDYRQVEANLQPLISTSKTFLEF